MYTFIYIILFSSIPTLCQDNTTNQVSNSAQSLTKTLTDGIYSASDVLYTGMETVLDGIKYIYDGCAWVIAPYMPNISIQWNNNTTSSPTAGTVLPATSSIQQPIAPQKQVAVQQPVLPQQPAITTPLSQQQLHVVPPTTPKLTTPPAPPALNASVSQKSSMVPPAPPLLNKDIVNKISPAKTTSVSLKKPVQKQKITPNKPQISQHDQLSAQLSLALDERRKEFNKPDDDNDTELDADEDVQFD